MTSVQKRLHAHWDRISGNRKSQFDFEALVHQEDSWLSEK
jgi:hypothetical protein